jgi:hypothetical protein
VITSDSTFYLADCRSVRAGRRWSSGYDLFYDGDMLILENLTAHKKGICIGAEGADLTEEEGRTVLRVQPIDDLDQFKSGDCTVVSCEAERVEIRVRAEQDGYLILQDTYYPGWEARVDGASSEILRTNMGLRAIELSRGDHTVIMEFKPRSFRFGLVLTVLGIVLAAVWARSARGRSA